MPNPSVLTSAAAGGSQSIVTETIDNSRRRRNVVQEQSYAAFERDPNIFSAIDLCNPSTFSPAPVAAGFILTQVDLGDEASLLCAKSLFRCPRSRSSSY